MKVELKEFQYKKSFGQNFIKEASIVTKIRDTAEILPHSLIIEIGPGAGSLTEKLVETGEQVLAYEIDLRLKEVLEEKFANCPSIDFIFDDFLMCDLAEDIKPYSFERIYVVANLPYYITTPILEKIIQEVDVYRMVIMVQKEVADRFTAKVGTKDYNSLTIFLNSRFDVKKEFLVSRNCFVPKPHVDSAVVSFTKKQVPYSIDNWSHFEKLVRDSFRFKRKTLRNNLTGYPLEKIEKVLKNYGHDLSVRAEALTIEEFVSISNELEKEA